MEVEVVRLWNDFAIWRVKSPLLRLASDFGPHINTHNKGILAQLF